MMTVSRARKNFRIALGVMLVASFTFCATATYFFVSVKSKKIKILEIAPTLFQIDIAKYQTQALFSDEIGRHDIALNLLNQGLFSPLYAHAGLAMIENLADDGYAPSQMLHGEIMLSYNAPNDANTQKAYTYIQAAADQGYVPAQEKIALLKPSPIK